jgi:ABC-type transport system involved in multi-copper enzyme maturation permease subunit
MIWVAWKHYRLVMVLGLVLLAGVSAFLITTGLQQLALFNELGLTNANNINPESVSRFLNSYDTLDNAVMSFPFILAIFGALLVYPIIIEFEQGTHRLAWTQSVTRRRWLWTKLAAALLGALVFSVILSALINWWYAPREQLQVPFDRFFVLRGVMPIAIIVFSLALALIMGVLTRKMVIALLAALVIFLVVMFGFEDTQLVQSIYTSIFLGASAILIGITSRVVTGRMR